ncbi:helix-turn-helix domain-containing protein [Candidatus Igneacidithiobacillus taiwanensis]|uniref:helix-turn-helix domain-containing protein n=1 Tax=Candidatus Igneacidithiobacillus taiwanensis TaxID=1945924 RepID=UPI0028973A87|nr:helix-turn-helix domain-containing protein [Candidatus Igneacidithiobacillus taiwanensis]
MHSKARVTANHVAQHSGKAEHAAYRWREHKHQPAHRVGRLWKFNLSEVDDWVRTRSADEEQRGDGQMPSRNP